MQIEPLTSRNLEYILLFPTYFRAQHKSFNKQQLVIIVEVLN